MYTYVHVPIMHTCWPGHDIMCLFLTLILTASEQDLPLGGGLCIQLA